MRAYNTSTITPIETIPILYVHPKIKFKDLNDNYKLFTDAQIAAVQNNTIIKEYQGRITKIKLNEIFKNEIAQGSLTEFMFSLERSGDNYGAIYSESLGKGTFGTVKVLQDLNSGETSEVLKVIKESPPENIAQEERGLRKIKTFRSIHQRPDKHMQFEIVMDIAKGSPLDKIAQRKLPTVVLIDLMINVLKEVNALHRQGILHCDLKPENIFFNLITGKATLVDLGEAAYTNNPTDITGGIWGDPRGTPGFMSEDAIRGRFSDKSEIYALAVTFAVILNLFEKRKVNFFGNEMDLNFVRETDWPDPSSQNKIPDETIRKAVLTLLQQMADKNNDLSLDDTPEKINLIEAFQKIREEYIDALGLTKTIAYLNIQDYIQANATAKKLMLDGLSKADEVWLLDENGVNKDNYFPIKHELVHTDLNVSDFVIQYQGNNLDKVMHDYAEQREMTDRNIYDCSYLTKTGQLASLEASLSQLQISKIINSLKDEIIRLKNKDPNAKDRIEMIRGTISVIQQLSENGSATLVSVIRQLDSLQTKMLADPESQNNIKTLMHEIESSSHKETLSTAPKGFEAVKEHRNIVKALKASKDEPQTSIEVSGQTSPTQPVESKQPAPQFQDWSQREATYLAFIQAAINGIQKSMNQQKKNKLMKFGNDELYTGTTFYMNLLDSAPSLFQKMVIILSLMENTEKKYSELKHVVERQISAEFKYTPLEPVSAKSLLEILKNMAPVRINNFLASFDKITASRDPYVFKEKVVQQLNEIDPTPEIVKEASRKRQL